MTDPPIDRILQFTDINRVEAKNIPLLLLLATKAPEETQLQIPNQPQTNLFPHNHPQNVLPT